MNEAILLLIGTLGGTVIGAIAGLAGAYIREKYETKRRTKELIINTAVEEWSKLFNFAQTRSGETEMFPLSGYIAHHTLLLEAVLKDNFDIEEFKKVIERSNAINEEIYKNDEKEREKLKGIKNPIPHV